MDKKEQEFYQAAITARQLIENMTPEQRTDAEEQLRLQFGTMVNPAHKKAEKERRLLPRKPKPAPKPFNPVLTQGMSLKIAEQKGADRGAKKTQKV